MGAQLRRDGVCRSRAVERHSSQSVVSLRVGHGKEAEHVCRRQCARHLTQLDIAVMSVSHAVGLRVVVSRKLVFDAFVYGPVDKETVLHSAERVVIVFFYLFFRKGFAAEKAHLVDVACETALLVVLRCRTAKADSIHGRSEVAGSIGVSTDTVVIVYERHSESGQRVAGKGY